MKPAFADTFYYLAILNPNDNRHADAQAISKSISAPLITTQWILTEVADALSAPVHRPKFGILLDALRKDQGTQIIPADSAWFDLGVNLFKSRPDKDWPLTDCISFVVMKQLGLTQALTGDKHFEQAGFEMLMK
ncbi:MAG TPA: PIN domain-containing protein [Planctomycetota bacterium]|nr:PIN domain-containing protein [Planctomycetota bacterium]